MVALIGMSCRLPGGVATPQDFWRLLRQGTDAVTPVPGGRWPHSTDEPASALRGGFLDQIDQFDADFAGVSPREAAAMDPQQRLVLELGWEACEDAGIVAPDATTRWRAGVFVGAINDDYAALLRRGGSATVTHHTLTGQHRGMIANRLSRMLGGTGPSVVVDSGQSSSLVAVHMACQSLRAGECDIAFAGGVNLNITHDGTLSVQRFGALSPDGRCYTFDARANGYVRGEGGGLVVLKPLARAIADGDRIHAVIRGSAVNNDGGGTDSVAAPNRGAQEDVLRDAYAAAGMDRDAVQYVELHGTGTAAGDPVEAAALGAVLGADRSSGPLLLVGSVKTNIGHLEGAAGIAGLIKVVLALRHRELPPSLNFATPNPAIAFDALHLQMHTALAPWPRQDAPLAAGVSSFGMGGTNAHVVLEQGPATWPEQAGTPALDGVLPWVVSARSADGLRGQAARLRDWDGAPADVAWSLATARAALSHRAVVVGEGGLADLAAGEPSSAVVTGSVVDDVGSGVVFVFPGQGSQWWGMADELVGSCPVFARTFRACVDALVPYVDVSGAPDRVDVVQPLLWAVMVSLAAVWRWVGVEPSAVVGHSQGEIAAACVAGILSLEDGARLVALRSRVIAAELAGRGGMVWVGASVAAIEELLPDGVWVAAVNGPESTVVAGSSLGLQEFQFTAATMGIRVRVVDVDYASHTPMVERAKDELLAVARSISPRAGDVVMVSTVTGAVVDGRELDADYWYRNLRERVRFADVVNALADDGERVFLEVSPHPVLTSAVGEIADVVVGTLRRGEGGASRFVTSMAELWVRGVAVDWRAVLGGGRRIDLPTYAFQRERHWLDVTEQAVETAMPRSRPATVVVPALDVAQSVRAQAGAVLGYARSREIDARRTFKDLGFDSVLLGDLCQRMNAALGLRLSTAALFDYPTPAGLIDHIESLRSGQADEAVPEHSRARQLDEPVAIIGMSCRYPGGVRSPEDLWDLVAAGRDAISGFPDDRGWDLMALAEGASPALGGGFLDDVAGFDARFFGVSPREALAMDPQQRLLLETSWEALERAGIVPDSLRGSRTGVFVGTMDQEYGPRLYEVPEVLGGHALTGKAASIVSGRVAYVLGLAGPAVTMDTACSSSLVALHFATRSLRDGECSLALVGGVTVLSTPGIFTGFSRKGLSRDGRCKAFGAGADGTGFAEGIGVLVVERLSDAVANGHNVLAVVRGSAINQDGASNGLTAPNGLAQQRVIRDALADAALDPSDVDVIEAHGTGTALGDPIEAQALLATYGQGHTVDRPVLLGSAKSNIGHTQAAAGMAGLIKMVMAMRHGVVPPTLHADEPSPHVDWSSGAVELATTTTAWPETGRPRRAGVSSFGISGTNAHVVVEQGPATPPHEPGAPMLDGVVPWVVSADTWTALRAQAGRLLEFPGDPADVACSLATARAALSHRAVVVGEGGLADLAVGEPSSAVVTGSVVDGVGSGVVFVFPGQGSQWRGMADELVGSCPVFARTFAECVDALVPYVDVCGVADRVDVVQPLLWAVMVSLAAVWRWVGVEPSVVVGHSQGEIAAACVAGILSVEDGARLVALRSRVIAAELAGRGGMVWVGASVAAIEELLPDGVWVAAVNGPESTVIAGEPSALREFMVAADAAGIRTRTVDVDYASHTPMVERARAELLAVARSISPRTGDVVMVSTVTGAVVDGRELDADYWYRNLRERVRFADVVRSLADDGERVFLEVSPHPVLTSAIADAAADLVVAGTLRRDEGGAQRFVTSMAELWVRGVAVAWSAVIGRRALVDLPTYAFQHERYWLAPATSGTPVQIDLPAAPEPDTASDLRRRVVAATTDAQRTGLLLAEVRTQAAAILRWATPDDIEIQRAFREQGFDSVTAVELRQRLVTTTGVALAPTVVFDHPTPRALADHIGARIAGNDDVEPAIESTIAADEPVAIIAMSCRFPGDVGSPDDLWRLLVDNRDVISGFPLDRGWRLDDLYDPHGDRSGTSYVRHGGFLHDAAEFDADFFGIAPREALAMDPQQRLLLEASWDSVERAGIDPGSLQGTRTGVFVGLVPHGYGSGSRHEDATGYLFTGSAGSVASGRIAYTFGLHGPAITVDTACSSSLVALHLAVQSLRRGECTLALAGGVTVMSTPTVFTEFSHQHGLAPDGRCKPFAAAADGTAWSEGVGVLVLERLSDAVANGRQVLAVVRGSAINQDGASNGLTAPSGPAQQRVIRDALASAGLASSDVDVVEAHGTGTELGDPIEAQALLATYGQRSADDPLLLGSMKSNVGHTSAAAGVAGVIKMVLAMRHGVVPATVHVDEPSPHVDWSSGAVRLVTANTAWPDRDRVRRAAVSSFGVSGTNAHVILEQGPASEAPDDAGGPVLAGVAPWVVSGHSPDGLRRQAVRLAELDADLVDVAWSLATARAALSHRAVVVGEGGLADLAAGEPSSVVVTGSVVDGVGSGAVFVFPGQGSQWLGMADELVGSCPVFARTFRACVDALAPYVDVSGALDRVDVVQPLLWAVMVSLAAVWRWVGVEPSVVVGHSQGEIAAACVAGILSLEDGARLVALRSRVIAAELAGRGGMVWVGASVAAIEELLPDGVWVAAVNGPGSTVVAGEPAGLVEFQKSAAAEGIRVRVVDVDYASHTPMVERAKDELLAVARSITPRTGDVVMVSTVTGAVVDGRELDADYWYRNLRERVRFADAVNALVADGERVFVEASPHPVLTSAIADAADVVVAGTLRRGEGGARRFVTSMAELWVRGVAVDWRAVLGGGRRIELPGYAFERKRYWLDAAGDDVHTEFWKIVASDDEQMLARELWLDSSSTDVSLVLRALSSWHRRNSAAEETASLRYQVEWRRLPDESAWLRGTWLVAVAPGQHDDPLAEDVLAALKGHGADAALLVLPDDETHWRDMLAEYPDAAGVVSLLAGDETVHPATRVVPTGFARTLALVAAVDVPLWCVTRGAMVVGDDVVSPAQALTWGLGHVVAQELPSVWGGLIDLQGTVGGDALDRMCAVLARGDEDQVAVGSAGAFGRRLVRATGRVADRDWTPGDGTVLVTGGTGALGAHVARWLAAQGARHLLLTSRQGAAARGAEEFAAQLRESGALVTIMACDIADPAALRDLVASAPDLTAVFHLAGVLDDAAVVDLSLAQVDDVLRVKADAAWQLHELTKDRELSAFVVFSSLAGTVGMAGQGNYAPANAYLDALARYRHGMGLAGMSIAWGSWSQGGMAARDVVAETSLRHGIPLMPPERAIAGLASALRGDDPNVVIADIDWNRFAHAYTAAHPSHLLDGIPEARAALTPDVGVGAGLRDRIADLGPREREQRLVTVVRALAAAVLGHDSPDAVGSNRPFLDMGLDSVTTVELRNRLGAAAGLRLPATVIFDHPTVAELAAHLGTLLFGDEEAAQPGSGELDRLAAIVGTMHDGEPARTEITRRLRHLLASLSTQDSPVPDDDDPALETVTNDELFDIIEKEFGIS